jgi:F420-non-reducing hydrogenase small subunit
VPDDKLQIAIYWGAACGGCDVSILDTDAFILEIDKAADIRLWPIATDGKYKDIEALADGELDVAIMSGAVRNSENERMAHLLRQKSKVFVAYGSCAYMGGIPSLANLVPREEIIKRAYLSNASLEPGNTTVPRPRTSLNGYDLELPEFYPRVYKLDQVVDVDYYVPGCPPQPGQAQIAITALVQALTGQAEAPPKGSVVGAYERALCDDCKRTKAEEKKVKRFYRPWEIMQDPEVCLMEQGILCAGSATRSGCGVRCPDSGIPCRGCYGPAPGVVDQGAKLLSAVASIIDSKVAEDIDEILLTLPDFTSFANRYSVAASPLQRSHRR